MKAAIVASCVSALLALVFGDPLAAAGVVIGAIALAAPHLNGLGGGHAPFKLVADESQGWTAQTWHRVRQTLVAVAAAWIALAVCVVTGILGSHWWLAAALVGVPVVLLIMAVFARLPDSWTEH